MMNIQKILLCGLLCLFARELSPMQKEVACPLMTIPRELHGMILGIIICDHLNDRDHAKLGTILGTLSSANKYFYKFCSDPQLHIQWFATVNNFTKTHPLLELAHLCPAFTKASFR